MSDLHDLSKLRNFAIVPADGKCDSTHPYTDGWRIIRSFHPEPFTGPPSDVGWFLLMGKCL